MTYEQKIRQDFARSGGKARAKSLSKKTRSNIASNAAKAKWAKYNEAKKLETNNVDTGSIPK